MAQGGACLQVFCGEEETVADIADSSSVYTRANKPAAESKYGRVYYQNVRGLRTKTETFHENLLSEEYDIIALTETWLCDGIFSEELFDERYNVVRKDRHTATRGGGVLVAFNKKLSYELLETKEECNVECLFVKLKFKKLSIIVSLKKEGGGSLSSFPVRTNTVRCYTREK